MKALHRLVSFLRARGEVGNNAWVARITGLDEEFGLKREFVKPKDSRTPSRKRGHLTFEITEPGYYEFGGFGTYGTGATKQVESGGLSGFVHVDERGCRDVSQGEVFGHFRRVEAVLAPSTQAGQEP